ncbi:hypothetical protein BC827DRAFT_1268004 [Russula dissimulans]|nr:hypothetical protein BC827DRAFT_1268004 [Russula dissimulans]
MFGLLWTADFEIVFAASSFYPGCGGDKPEHAVSYASPVSSVSSGSDNNGRDTETGSDHANEQEMVELAQKQPSRFCATVALELYVALLKWSTGHYQLVEFAANRFLDVYKGHVQSLENIQRWHPSAFHQMMAGIYSQSIQLVTTQTMGVPPIELDMDNLEE